MAKGDNEHRMLFDLRGKRRNVVKVVYATLAVLMGLSLFLVIGGFNIAELFNSGTTGDAAETYEEQAERIGAKLKKDPNDPDLLLALTRAQINAGNAQVEVEANGARTFSAGAIQAYQEAYNSWSEYLEATDQPQANLAQLMAPTILQLAEFSRSYAEVTRKVEAAIDAQKIVVEQRPSLNSFSTLAFYTYFTGDFEAAEEARAKANKFANSASERETIDRQLDEYKKNAELFLREKERAERQQKTQGGGSESLENPLGGGVLGE